MYQQVEALVGLHRPDEAIALAREALALAEEIHGTQSTELNGYLVALMWALRASDRCAEVFPLLDRFEAIASAAPQREPGNDAEAELQRARCLAVSDRADEAGPSYDRALVRFEQLYGPGSRQVAEVLLAQARWQATHGSRASAIASLERAREICRVSEGDPALDRAVADELARQARDHG
jgi:tetratricopeptide (TPR) repeat protein